MNTYQLTLLLNNTLDEKARQAVLDSVTKQLDKVDKQDLWGVRSLSYPILKQDRAFYAHFEFQSDPQKISSIDKTLKLNEDILRHLLIRRD